MSQQTDIAVRVGADIEPLKQGLNQAKGRLGGLKSAAGSSAKAVAGIAAAAAVAGAAIATALVAKAMGAIDAQAKLAKQLGTTSTSMATLDRAAELSGVSMGDLSTGARTLNTRLSEAAQGTGQAVGALEDLGLTAEELQGMTLDKKIATINTALKENVPAAERAAVAADLFGQRAGVAMVTLDAATIGAAAKQMQDLGLAISDVDASKIEQANDAMSGVMRIGEGVTQQMAIQLAPIIGDISNRMLGAAGATGGFQDAISKAVEIGIKGAGFLGDSFRGFQVIVKGLEMAFWGFSVVVNRVLQAIPESVDFVVNSAKASINGLIDGMNKLPGVDISNLVYGNSAMTQMMQETTQTAMNNLKDSTADMHNLLMEPLPSTSIASWYEEVKATSEAASQKIVQDLKAANELVVNELPTPTEAPIVQNNQAQLDAMASAYQAYGVARVAAEKVTQQEVVETQKAFGSQSLNAYSKLFGDLGTLMDSKNRGMFEIGKKAAQSQTLIDTYASAQSAFKSLSGIPVVGPALGAAAAGAAIVAGAGRLASISATSFGSKTAPSPATGGGGSAAVASPGAIGSSSGASSTMFVEGISQDKFYSGGNVRQMAEDLLEFQRDGGQVVLT